MDRIEAFMATEGLGDRVRSFIDHQAIGANREEYDAYNQYKHQQKRAKQEADTFAVWKQKRDKAAREKKYGSQEPNYGPAYIKKTYGLELTPITPEQPPAKRQLILMMRADVSKWLQTIKSSQKFKTWASKIVEVCKAGYPEEGEYAYIYEEGDPLPKSVADIAKAFKVGEGVNGWDESMEIIPDENQEFRIEAGWVCFELADMLGIKYGQFLNKATGGDGDEGHIYYIIKDL